MYKKPQPLPRTLQLGLYLPGVTLRSPVLIDRSQIPVLFQTRSHCRIIGAMQQSVLRAVRCQHPLKAVVGSRRLLRTRNVCKASGAQRDKLNVRICGSSACKVQPAAPEQSWHSKRRQLLNLGALLATAITQLPGPAYAVST